MKEFNSWGKIIKPVHSAINMFWRNEIPYDYLNANEQLLPFGNGRSYGDVCINNGGNLLITQNLNKIIQFDKTLGRITCESGVLLSDLLALIVPTGWFIPVTPGTQFITLGGAIANDVHGKNHHIDGTFGCHILGFELLRSTGERLLCTNEQNKAFFSATIGGLGLTGVIIWVEIQLKRITSNVIDCKTQRFSNLREYFDISVNIDKENPYTVAWIDALSTGKNFGRGVLISGSHSTKYDLPINERSLSIPITPPISLVNKTSASLFNHLYYAKSGKKERSFYSHYRPFFYPLDRIQHWNRIYGKKGFYQYQCVLPESCSEDALNEILRTISLSGLGSFLAVLKKFGNVSSPGLLSFPLEGVTLAVDFPNNGQLTLNLLNKLDKITAEAKGRVYIAKDARMSPENFQCSYPSWRQLENLRDPLHNSSFWKRVTKI